MMSPTTTNIPDYLSPFTGEGVDFRDITNTGLDVRPIPLSAGVLQKSAPWRYEHVFSPFCRLYFARHGDMYIRANGKTFHLPRHGFLLIPAELHFHCGTDGSSEHLWIHFRLHPPWLEGFRLPVPIEANATTRNPARRIWQHLEAHAAPHQQVHMIKALLHLLFSDLNLTGRSLVPHQLQRALRIIQEHLQSPLAVRELAKMAGYSPEHLAHLFRKHLRLSPSEFIRNTRIREAARRLAYTTDTIEAIADDLCFANRHHLSRVFKMVIKEPPAAFRDRIKKQHR
jgi:AraC-like DNA-binding protein